MSDEGGHLGNICNAANECIDANAQCLAIPTYDDRTEDLLYTQDLCYTKTLAECYSPGEDGFTHFYEENEGGERRVRMR